MAALLTDWMQVRSLNVDYGEFRAADVIYCRQTQQCLWFPTIAICRLVRAIA